MTENLKEKAQAQVASGYQSLAAMRGEGEAGERYSRGELIYGPYRMGSEGEDQSKSISIKSSETDKIAFAVENIKNMESFREAAKLTAEELRVLTEQALGPQNEEFLKATQLTIKLSNTLTDANGKFVTSDQSIKSMKNDLAGLSQATIESIPNLSQYGALLQQLGIDYDTYNSNAIDAAVLTGDLSIAVEMVNDGTSKTDVGKFTNLLAKMKGALEGTGGSLLSLVPNLGQFWHILQQIGITIDQLPESKNVDINGNYTPPPTEGEGNAQPTEPPPGTVAGHKGGFVEKFHLGGLIERFHTGGSLNYSPWGNLSADEKPIIAQKGEYVLSREDVEFVNKVKGNATGLQVVNNFPPVLPRVNVVVNNQSGTKISSSGAIRVSDSEYIVDILLKDLHSNGRLRNALSFS
jgi:hypothetical protein